MNLSKIRDSKLASPNMKWPFECRRVSPLSQNLDVPENILNLYGPEVTKPGTFAASALLARRMVERGVRVVQLLHRCWDQHGNIANDLPAQCRDVDQACAALVTDLKQREACSIRRSSFG